MPLNPPAGSPAAPLTAPLTNDQFGALMAPLAPFGSRREVVAAVSGGADSMALALLLQRWGSPLAVVLDHGLRPESLHEAEQTMDRLRSIAMPARLLRLGLESGPNLGARARTARYAALLEVCRTTGLPDVVLGHHRQDQSETMLLRAASGSGAAGLAGMAPIVWRGDARLLRPLLGIPPGRLRATLRQAGLDWIEDPTNRNPASVRGALRLAGVDDGAAVRAARWAVIRQTTERRVSAELAAAVTLYPGGFAQVVAPMSVRAWSSLVWTISGRAYPPSRRALSRILARGGGTLHGVAIRSGWVVREAAAAGPPIPAFERAVWDGRVRVSATTPGAEWGALAGDAPRLRRRPGLPSLVMRMLPALRLGTELLAVPDLAYPDDETCLSVQVDYCPPHPLAGAPFGLVGQGEWPGMHIGPGHPMSIVTEGRHGAPRRGHHHAS